MKRQRSVLMSLTLGMVMLLSSSPGISQATETRLCGKERDESGQIIPDQDKSNWCKGSRKKRNRRIKRIKAQKEKAEKLLDEEPANGQDPEQIQE